MLCEGHALASLCKPGYLKEMFFSSSWRPDNVGSDFFKIQCTILNAEVALVVWVCHDRAPALCASGPGLGKAESLWGSSMQKKWRVVQLSLLPFSLPVGSWLYCCRKENTPVPLTSYLSLFIHLWIAVITKCRERETSEKHEGRR